MNKKYTDYLFKILLIIIAAVVGWILYAVTANILIFANVFSESAIEKNMGYDMTQKAITIWLISVILSVGFLFIKDRFRYFFLALPLLSPSLFAFLYATTI